MELKEFLEKKVKIDNKNYKGFLSLGVTAVAVSLVLLYKNYGTEQMLSGFAIFFGSLVSFAKASDIFQQRKINRILLEVENIIPKESFLYNDLTVLAYNTNKKGANRKEIQSNIRGIQKKLNSLN